MSKRVVKNTLAKGRRIELRAAKHLEKQGYKIQRVVHTKFQKKDLFGLFDLIAKKKYVTGYIQVKTNRCPKRVFSDIKVFAMEYGNRDDAFEIWIWKDEDKNFETHQFTKGDWKYIGRSAAQ